MCYDEGNETQVPDFEPFMEVSNKAQGWIKEQEGKRIINIQTLQYRLPWDPGKELMLPSYLTTGIQKK